MDRGFRLIEALACHARHVCGMISRYTNSPLMTIYTEKYVERNIKKYIRAYYFWKTVI